jgi:hypothetical protein
MTWTPRTRADDLRDLAKASLARYGGRDAKGRVVSPEPASPDGIYMRDRCSCGRLRPVFELVDARLIPEHPGDYACGACRELYIRLGIIGSGEWVRRMGAPQELVERLAAKDRRFRGE